MVSEVEQRWLDEHTRRLSEMRERRALLDRAVRDFEAEVFPRVDWSKIDLRAIEREALEFEELIKTFREARDVHTKSQDSF